METRREGAPLLLPREGIAAMSGESKKDKSRKKRPIRFGDPIPLRLEIDSRERSRRVAEKEGVQEVDVLRFLLEPALKLAEQFGLFEARSDLRQQANEALGLSSGALNRKLERAKARLPQKSNKSGGQKMEFG